MTGIILDARKKGTDMKRRRLQIRISGHRQPFSYDPSTGRWTLTWEDKPHSGVAKTVREARAAVRRATRRLVLVEVILRLLRGGDVPRLQVMQLREHHLALRAGPDHEPGPEPGSRAGGQDQPEDPRQDQDDPHRVDIKPAEMLDAHPKRENSSKCQDQARGSGFHVMMIIPA